MSTNRLGRVENLDQFWHQTHLKSSESRVDLKIPEEPETVESLDEISEYPYDGQDRYSGTLEFHFTDWQGNSRTEDGEYEYRSESGLFLLQLDSGRVDPEDILETLNQQFGNSGKIKDSISVKREALWSFFEEADQYDTLTLTGPEGRFDFTTLKQVAHRVSHDDIANYNSIEDLELSAEIQEPEKVQDVLPLLNKVDLHGDIESINDLGVDPAKYFIERSEVHFEFRDELVSVTYDRGNLRINDDATQLSREYVTQLFEQKVVYPSYGR